MAKVWDIISAVYGNGMWLAGSIMAIDHYIGKVAAFLGIVWTVMQIYDWIAKRLKKKKKK